LNTKRKWYRNWSTAPFLRSARRGGNNFPLENVPVIRPSRWIAIADPDERETIADALDRSLAQQRVVRFPRSSREIISRFSFLWKNAFRKRESLAFDDC